MAALAGIDALGEAARTGDGRLLYLVQFDGPILAEWRAALEGAGAEIRDYIPDFAYKVAIADEDVAALSALPGVIWQGPFASGYGVSPEVASSVASAPQAARAELDEPPSDAFIANLAGLGLRFIGAEGRSLAVAGDTVALAALSRQAGVRWMAPRELPQVNNDVAAGQIGAPTAWAAGYAGQGQVINLADTGVDTGTDAPGVADIHADLNDRGQAIASWPISSLWAAYYDNAGADDGAADENTGHGTHVAGSAVGNGAASGGARRGVAPQAGWTFQALEQWGEASTYGLSQGVSSGFSLLGIPAALGALSGQAYAGGARVSSNCGGYSTSLGRYTRAPARPTVRLGASRYGGALCRGNEAETPTAMGWPMAAPSPRRPRPRTSSLWGRENLRPTIPRRSGCAATASCTAAALRPTPCVTMPWQCRDQRPGRL